MGAFQVIKDNLHGAAYRAAAKNLSEADYQRCFIMLNEMAKKINSTGDRFVILDWANYNWFYKPLSDISNFIPTDGHPSATANQTITQWLATHTTFNN